MLNWILSIMVHKKILSEQEAEYLSKELTTHTHPHLFKDAHDLVAKLFQDYNKTK